MLSRVAESIYWMRRYIERAENVARFIEVNFNLTLDDDFTVNSQWQPLIDTTGDDDDFRKRYHASSTRDNVLRFLLFDRENPNSIISCVRRGRENARAIRQILPSVFWEELNKFYLLTKDAAATFQQAGETDLEETQAFCEKVRLSNHLLDGALAASMSKGEAWHFATLGQMLERADKTSRIVDVQYFLLLPRTGDVGSTLDVIRWSALLQSSNALAMYRREHGNITPTRVADFLILDRYFPRSMHHCVLAAESSLLAICEENEDALSGSAMEYIVQLRTSMAEANIEQIIGRGMHEYIDGFQGQLNRIGDAISEQFFTWNAAVV